MSVFSGLVVIARLGLAADAQPIRFKTHLDLLPVEPGNFGTRGKLFAGFRKVELYRFEQFGFSEEPILSVISLRVSAALEYLEGAQCNQMEYVLGMFEKFMNGYEI